MTENCSQCGREIRAEEWHPVTTLRLDDETIEIHDFCDEVCRSAWKAQQAEETDWSREEPKSTSEQIVNSQDA